MSRLHERIRALLDGGYNHYATRPLSSNQSRTELRKKIEIRLRMAKYGVAPWAQRAGNTERAHMALLTVYRMITDEEIAEYQAASEKRSLKTGSVIVTTSIGSQRRFDDGRKAIDWAHDQIKGKPGARAEFSREHAGKRLLFQAMEANEYGNVHYAAIYPEGQGGRYPEWK